jgi:hypothetical protein
LIRQEIGQPRNGVPVTPVDASPEFVDPAQFGKDLRQPACGERITLVSGDAKDRARVIAPILAFQQLGQPGRRPPVSRVGTRTEFGLPSFLPQQVGEPVRSVSIAAVCADSEDAEGLIDPVVCHEHVGQLFGGFLITLFMACAKDHEGVLHLSMLGHQLGHVEPRGCLTLIGSGLEKLECVSELSLLDEKFGQPSGGVTIVGPRPVAEEGERLRHPSLGREQFGQRPDPRPVVAAPH